MGMKFDRLSNLPLDVLEQILSCLPIKEAVKTSVLSSNWRYKSAMLPHLVFDDQCVPAQNHAAFVKIVDHVLHSHIGPIHKFKLSHHHLEATSDIDRWILHLSRNAIKEFILEIWTRRRYSFGSLKSMDFQRVHLSQDVLENMIVCCPLLEKLTLANCHGFTHFKINAPNLQIFDLEGDYEDFILKNTSNLAQVCIDLDVKVDQRQILDLNCSNLLKFFADLPNIRRLEIQSCFLKYLAVGALPEKLPEPCLHLEFVSLCVSFSDLDEILTLLCLLRSSPALKNLEILVPQEHQAVAREVKSWLHDHVNFHFTQLRFVKINRPLWCQCCIRFHQISTFKFTCA
ncbi:hypothetical protein M0R45_036495 [Rubus argutus]|uniref:F-box domain-containing protein n=1 Tax=Rubus argutus TaxID=59490 RepID=A0AAW1VZU6_RUBAR